MSDKEQFAKYPAYLLFEDYRSEFYPKEWKQSGYVYRITDHIETLDPENNVVYVAFTKPFLDSNIQEWEENKSTADQSFISIDWIFTRIDLILSVFDPSDW